MNSSTYLQHSIKQINYDESIQLLEAWRAMEPLEVDLENGMRWLTHGRKTRRAILLLHGYTNCPRQFYQLGERFYQSGLNVVIPRFPGHALRDRMTDALAGVTLEQLLDTLSRSLEILTGLGEERIVMGLSMGGILAGWVAQIRPEIKAAVIISPAIGMNLIPAKLTGLAVWLAQRLPNVYLWWDPIVKDAPRPPLHAYPRYATRSLGMIVDLGQALLRVSAKAPPKVGMTIVVTNSNDTSVDIKQVDRLAENWLAAGAMKLKTYDFDADYQLGHDLIDPDQPDQKVELVYPILLRLVDEIE